MRLAKAGCHQLGKAGCPAKSRQDVAGRLFAHSQTASLLSSSAPGCHQTAADRPVQRRFIQWSGRRDANPRQPAGKADRRQIAARLLSSSFRRAFTHRTRHPSSIEADGRTRWEADGYLLSLPSYPLLLQNASTLGKMFYLSLFGNDHEAFQTPFVRTDSPCSQYSRLFNRYAAAYERTSTCTPTLAASSTI
jgi:hypothetical protein